MNPEHNTYGLRVQMSHSHKPFGKRRTMYVRIKPAMHLCHLYGMGHLSGALRFAYAPMVVANITATILIYYYVITSFRARMPGAFSTDLITSVARLNAKFLAPPLMIASMCWHRAAVLDCLCALDDLVPSARHYPLTPAGIHFACWLTATLATELGQLMAFHIRTGYIVYSSFATMQFVLSNVWPVTAVLIYTFLVETIRHGFRDVNGELTTMGQWSARRSTWQALHKAAMHLTDTVFGPIIVTFITFTIWEMAFFGYVAYLTFVNNMFSETAAYTTMMIVRSGLMVHLFRTCQHCKAEVSCVGSDAVNYPEIYSDKKIKMQSVVKYIQYYATNILK